MKNILLILIFAGIHWSSHACTIEDIFTSDLKQSVSMKPCEAVGCYSWEYMGVDLRIPQRFVPRFEHSGEIESFSSGNYFFNGDDHYCIYENMIGGIISFGQVSDCKDCGSELRGEDLKEISLTRERHLGLGQIKIEAYVLSPGSSKGDRDIFYLLIYDNDSYLMVMDKNFSFIEYLISRFEDL